MARIDNEGNWIDPKGNAIPKKYVKPIDKKRDRVVENFVKKWQKLQEDLAQFKAELIEGFEDYTAFVLAESGAKIGGVKGNVTLTNFSATWKIERAKSEFIEFDERINIVKTIIEACIKKWSKDVVSPIKPIVEKVFEVDHKGRMNIKGLKSLKELNIKDQQWQRAMEILDEAEKVTGTKTYFRVYERKGPEDNWKHHTLDFANILPRKKKSSKKVKK